MAKVRRAVAAALEVGGGEWSRRELSVVFVDDADLARMHDDWLDDPTLTDVITFDLREDPSGPAGELYVSVERALDVSARRRIEPLRELLLYVVHGVLHLCGFDDHDPLDRRRMRAAERRAFARIEAAPGLRAATNARSRANKNPPSTRT